MAPDREVRIRALTADLLGFDISGFSRFAETWLAQGEGSGVDDLARLWDRTAAPQIDRLIDAGFEIADLCGDGVVAFRAEPLASGVTERLLAGIETEFTKAAPALSLRTAHVRGELALLAADALGQRYQWASGAGVDTLHDRLSRGRRVAAGPLDPGLLGSDAQDARLARQWSERGAEVRTLAVLFARLAPEPWMWTDTGRIGATVRTIAGAAAAEDGALEKISHDDKGLLFRCAFVGSRDDALTAGARAGRAIVAAVLAAETGVAVCEGLAYRGPLRVGPDSPDTIHGPAVNQAAKAAGRAVGLLVLADAEPTNLRLASLGLVQGPDRGWRQASPHSGAATPSVAQPETEVFVGRQAALARLRGLLGARPRAPRVAVIDGAAGLGKSTLVRRFLDDLPAGWRVAQAQAAPVDGLHGPWGRLIPAMVAGRFPDRDDATRALAGTMAAEGLHPSEFGLLQRLGVDLFSASPALADLEPLALRERLDRAFRAVLSATAGRVIIVLEDVHWLGAEGWRWAEICAASDNRGVLLLTRRPSGMPPAPQPLEAQTAPIRLKPLGDAEARALVHARRPDLRRSPEAGAALVLLAAGSPLLLEQLALAWPSPGAPEFEAFGRQLGESADGVLRRVLDLRFDRLDARETDLLRRLAVETRARPLSELGAGQDADGAARRLVGLGLAHAERDGALSPRHALIAEAVRKRTPGLLLRALHMAAARRLARSGDAEAAVAGAHWREARRPIRAAVCFARAASVAGGSGALRAAADLYEQALDLCPAAAAEGVRAADWRSRLAACAFGLGELARARSEAQRCEAAAAQLGRGAGDSRRRALLVQTEIATFTADVGTAWRCLRGLRRLGATDLVGLRGREAALWGYALALVRLEPLAHRLLDRAGAHGPLDRYYVQASRGLIHNCFGRWDAAEQALAEAIALAPADRLPHENEIAATLLALGCYLRGRPSDSLSLFDAILQSGRARDNAMHEAWGLYGGAQALIALGELDEAGLRLDRAEMLLQDHIDRQSRLICSGLRVTLADRRGDLDAMLAAMRANLDLSASMPASNFGSFEGYAATPTAAMGWLERDPHGPTSEELRTHAAAGMRALAPYARLFVIGRPRLHLLKARRAHAEGRPRRARAERARGLSLAERLRMPGERAHAPVRDFPAPQAPAAAP